MGKKIIISLTFDPAYNLALEEYLIESQEEVLYLWQNNNTIVIGRNQNPYKECNIKKMEQDGIELTRRKSGGGAVFHDLGNLNFTIISPKSQDNVSKNFALVNRALRNLGIKSVFNGRNDLHVGGKKISGNAFYEKGDIFCHHGTLLIDVDMEKLAHYLTPSKLKLKSKSIDSVKSRVVNLVDLNKKIHVKMLKDALISEYKGMDTEIEVERFSKEDMASKPLIMEKVKVYKSWEWLYGESPKSNISYEEKFSFGLVNLELQVEFGIIENATIYTDSIINDGFSDFAKELEGKEFKKENIIKAIENNIYSKLIKESLIKRIEKNQ